MHIAASLFFFSFLTGFALFVFVLLLFCLFVLWQIYRNEEKEINGFIISRLDMILFDTTAELIHKSKVCFVCPPVCLSDCPSVCKPSVSLSLHGACRIKPSFGAPSLSYIAWLSVCPTLHGIRQRVTARQSSDRAAINTAVHCCHLLWGGRNLCRTHPAYHAAVYLARTCSASHLFRFICSLCTCASLSANSGCLSQGEASSCKVALLNPGLSLWPCIM